MNIVIAKLQKVEEKVFTNMVEAADYIDSAANVGVLSFAIKVKNNNGKVKILHFNDETREWEEESTKVVRHEHPFVDMEPLFLLRSWEMNLESDTAKLLQCNEEGNREEADTWRECKRFDLSMISSYERSIKMKKAYLFG